MAHLSWVQEVALFKRQRPNRKTVCGTKDIEKQADAVSALKYPRLLIAIYHRAQSTEIVFLTETQIDNFGEAAPHINTTPSPTVQLLRMPNTIMRRGGRRGEGVGGRHSVLTLEAFASHVLS